MMRAEKGAWTIAIAIETTENWKMTIAVPSRSGGITILEETYHRPAASTVATTRKARMHWMKKAVEQAAESLSESP